MKYFVLLALLWVPSLAVAGVPEDLKRDFSPVEGYVVEQIGDEFLVDLDASDGLRTGDILTLVVAGKEIKHPVSGETIGTLDATHEGFLRVSRLKEGYSFATLLPDSEEPQKGDPVIRFDQVPALLKSPESTPDEQALELQAALPHLKWETAASAAESVLVTFELGPSSLTVDMGGSENDRVYPFNAEGTSAAAVIPAAVPVGVAGSDAEAGAKAEGESVGIIRTDTSAQENIWYGPHIDDAVIGITSGDFDGDGRQEMAIACQKTLLIARLVQREYRIIKTLEIDAGKIVLGIDSSDLDRDGLAEIYVSAFVRNQMASFQVGYSQGEYRVVETAFPWNLRVIDVPGEGEVMLGQRMVEGDKFWGKVFQIVREGQTLVEGEQWSIPYKATLSSFTLFMGADGETLSAYLTADDYLHIADAAGKMIWESPEYMGGSETRLEREIPEADEEVTLFVRPRIMVDSQGEILVTENEGQRIMDRYRSFKKSKLVAMSWNGLAMNTSWETISQNGYLADFDLGDVDNDGLEELVTAAKFARKGLLNWSNRSGIVVYELQ